MIDFVTWGIRLSYILDIVALIAVIIFLVVYVIKQRESSWSPHKSKTNVKKRISDSKK